MDGKEKKHDMALYPRKAFVQDGRRRLGSPRARGLVFAVPALLTLGFAMRPTHAKDPYVFNTDPELDRRIDAYMPVVVATQPYMDRTGKVDERQADRLAQHWIVEMEAGRLKSLRPLILGDAVLEGTTGQIIKVQSALANTLMLRGERRVRQGELRAGAEDLIRASRIFRSTQYSDFQTTTLVGLQVRRALNMLERVDKEMSPQDQVWLKDAVLPLRSDPRLLCDMALTMRRLYEEQAWKDGENLPDAPGLDALAGLGKVDPESPNALMESVSEALKAPNSPEAVRPLTASLRRVLLNEIATNKRIDAIRMP